MRITPTGRWFRLADIYDDWPDDDEILWEFVSAKEYDNTMFAEVKISPSQWCNESYVGDGVSVCDSFEHATKRQKKIVKEYQKEIRDGDDIGHLVIIGGEENRLVDGHHRLIACYEEGVKSVLALDLAQEKN